MGFIYLVNKSWGTGMRLPSHARGTAGWTYVLNPVFILLTTILVFCATVYNKICCFVQKKSQIVLCAKLAPTNGLMCNFLVSQPLKGTRIHPNNMCEYYNRTHKIPHTHQ
jgi:hypothetical protein